MKFLHLADLHLGKRVNGFDLLEDQRYILEQILALCDSNKVDAVVLAGDIYDAPVPPAAACTLLDWFLTQLAARRIAVLENVMNPTNIGAIFRCAAALGMDAVLLTPACSNPLYRRAIRVSMGTVFQVPWAYFPKYNVGSDNTFSDTSLHDKCDSSDQNCSDRNSSVYKYNIDVLQPSEQLVFSHTRRLRTIPFP